MTRHPAALLPAERLLRHLLSPAEPHDERAFAAMDEEDWAMLRERAVQHRIEPLLHRLALEDPVKGAAVPSEILSCWSEAARILALDGLQKQHVLSRIGMLFDRAGIMFAALKGVPLAFDVYRQAGARPLRDLDIAVRSDADLKRGWQLLLDDGFRPEDEDGDALADAGHGHQLRPLLSPDGRHYVELHHRLFHGAGDDPVDDEDFWTARDRLDLLGNAVPVPGRADLLLHLVIHAMRDHRFDNGPLIVSDVALLERDGGIDPARLEAVAHRHDAAEEIALVRDLARAAWEGREAPAERQAAINAAWALMLSDPDRLKAAKIHRRLSRAPLSGLRERLLPGSDRLASLYGTREGRLGKAARLGGHWTRMVARRLPAFLARPGGNLEQGRLAALEDSTRGAEPK